MTEITVVDLPDEKPTNYLNEGHTLASWLTTTDHKRIAILYALSITAFFFIGGIAIAIVRLELIHPQGGLLTDDQYNRLFTMHGIVMVWFFLVPSIPTTLGNFLLPLMIGVRDVAFPRSIFFRGTCSRSAPSSPSIPSWSAASTPAGPSTRRSRRCFPTATSSQPPPGFSWRAFPRSPRA